MHTAASCFTPFGCHKYTFWCKLTRIPRLHNTVLVFFYPIQIRIVSGLHYCGVNVHHVGVTFTLNWCSHSCKNLHFFGVTITLSLFLSYTNAILASTAIWLSRKPVCVPGQYSPVRPFPGSFVYGVRKANPVIHCAGKVFCFNEFIFVSRVNLDQHSTVILACRICVVPRLSCCEKFIT